MPVFRVQAQASVITAEQRKQVAEQLAKELSGQPTPNGPIIFEIPLESQGRIDVLVVWEAWKPFSSTDRSNMILEAYKDTKLQIAQALGVTNQEAVEQQVLPYAVLPMIRRGEVNEDEVREAMLAEGGILLDNGKVELRFPTMSLAEQAHRHLTDALPKGYWSIVQTVGYIQ
jgi:hypothetical protein